MLKAGPDAALDAAPLDDATIDWSRVVDVTFAVRQELRYDYPGPIADLRHRLMIAPRAQHGAQRRLSYRLTVNPDAATTTLGRDTFGNPVVTVRAKRVDASLAFELATLVRRVAEPDHRVARALLEAPAYRRATRLTRADGALRDAADALRSDHRDPRDLADALNAFTHGRMRYENGVTGVHTTAAQAFALGRGVCQDYAHVMLALARHAGLAARYVSGHLIGEGGTHAWVEIFVPDGDDARVLAFDPTHLRRVGMTYVVVAVGRDYADVAPTSGAYTAPYAGSLSARKRVDPVRVAYAA